MVWAGLGLVALAVLMFVAAARYRPAQADMPEENIERIRPTPEPTPTPTPTPSPEPRAKTAPQTRRSVGATPQRPANQDKTRFDLLAIELQNNPGSTGYVIAYAGHDSRAGEADRMGRRALDYLLTERGIDRDRLVFIDGGRRESNTFELWVIPQGAEPPRPTPTDPPGASAKPPRRRKGLAPQPTPRATPASPPARLETPETNTAAGNEARADSPVNKDAGPVPTVNEPPAEQPAPAPAVPVAESAGGNVGTIDLGEVSGYVMLCPEAEPKATPPAQSRLRRWLSALLRRLRLTRSANAEKQNKKNQQPTTGRIEVSTQPGGYPISIDGQPAGETTDSTRAIDLAPGAHTVEVQFPGDNRWAQTLNIAAGRQFCIALNYRPRTIEIPAVATSPCPYPVNVTAPARVNDGDIVTFTADVGYQGQSALNYRWTVSPPAARILSGVGTPTITVDSSGLGNRRVTAILVVDDGSGDRSCRQTAQAATGVSGLPARPPAKRFDEFVSAAHEDGDGAQPDNVAPTQRQPPQVGSGGPPLSVSQPAKERDKIVAHYPQRLLKDIDSTLRVELSRVLGDVVAGTTTTGGQAQTADTPGEVAGATHPREPLAGAFGSDYKASATVTLLSDDLVMSGPSPQPEQPLGVEPLAWSWQVRPKEGVEERASFTFKLDVVWRAEGRPDIHRSAVWEKKIEVPVGAPTAIELLRYGSPASGAAGGGAMLAGVVKRRKRRRDGDEDEAPAVETPGAAAAGPVADEVYCSAFGPKSARPGDRFLMPVFAHLAEQEGGLDKLAAVYEAGRLSTAKALEQKVERESRLYFSLRLPGLLVDEPEMSLVWKGKPASCEFAVSVPKDFEPGTVIGTVMVSVQAEGVARVPIGNVKFMLKVVAGETPRAAAGAQAPVTPPAPTPLQQRYVAHKTAFISYSSKNRAEVKKRVQGLRAVGIECFMDKMSLTTGKPWEVSLYQFIDLSDIFCLFWSRAASESKPVMDEIEYALSRKGDDWQAPPEIIPVPLEPTTVVEPPEKLRHLHFDDLMLSLITAEETAQQQPAQG